MCLQNMVILGLLAFLYFNFKWKGKRIHTQNSAYLEDGKKSYDEKKGKYFLKAWNQSTCLLNPSSTMKVFIFRKNLI